MRLRLFRWRRWWPGNRRTRRAGFAQPPRRLRRGRPRGSHRLTGGPGPAARPAGAASPSRGDGLDAAVRPAPAAPAANANVVDPGAGTGPDTAASAGLASRPSAADDLGKPVGAGQAVAAASSIARSAERVAVRPAPGAIGRSMPAMTALSRQSARVIGTAMPWYETSRTSQTAAGLRHCGPLEKVLFREWAPDEEPAPESVVAITRLAELPQLIKERLAAGLRAIHVGAGGVPDLDHMGGLKGEPLPSGRATWDACAGAYGDRKIIIGSRPSPTPDVTCHEVGHALDEIDGTPGHWQSDAAEFRTLYDRCAPHMASEFHRPSGALGRREFFADAFAAIASSQRPALVEMLSGNTRVALDVMLYFNVRYGM